MESSRHMNSEEERSRERTFTNTILQRLLWFLVKTMIRRNDTKIKAHGTIKRPGNDQSTDWRYNIQPLQNGCQQDRFYQQTMAVWQKIKTLSLWSSD